MSGAVHVSREAGLVVRVISQGPFSVGSRVWRDAGGRLTCTIVAKATYALAPGESAPLHDPIPIQEDDLHRDGDRSRSVHVPSDLAPFKRKAEVVVVGSAFASREAASILARVVVGDVDKSLEVFPPRHARADGSVESGAPIVRHPLGYEHAAGGPNTDNPAGIDVTRADGRGFFPMSQLLAPLHANGAAGSRAPTWGFGPIASTWPARAGLLGSHDRAWLRQPAAAAMPAAFPPNFFQTAPPDQWLYHPVAPSEAIVLEGLHPELRRLAMSLSDLTPRAVVAGPRPEVVRLTGDLILVDTDRGICTVTFRGQIPLGPRGERVVVVGVPVATELSPEDLRGLVEGDSAEVEATHVVSAFLDPPADSTCLGSLMSSLPVLPFRVEPTPQLPRPSSPDGELSHRAAAGSGGEIPPAPAPARAPAHAPPPTATLSPAPPPVSVAAPPPLSAPAPSSARPIAPIPVAPAAPRLAPAIGPPPPFEWVASPKLAQAPSPAAAPAGDSGKSARVPTASFDAAFGGVKAFSDAAALATRAASPDAASHPPVRAYTGFAPEASGQRQAVVSLISFDAAVAARLRRATRFAAALQATTRPKRPQGVDSPRQEPRDERGDVLRALSFGRPADAAEIERSLTDCLDDPDDLDRPLVLVAGELRPTFDEIETLGATVAVVKQVAGADKKVLASLALGQDALAAPIAPRPKTTLGLVRQIEQAALALSLPPRYVPAEVERVLVEGRKYKRRTVLGAARVRAELQLPGGGEARLVYLPDTAATSLPLLVAFAVVALCEVIPREDLGEAQDEALLAVAIGRVIRRRSPG